MTTNTQLIIDSDGGVDDAAALWYASVTPGLQLLAVTAVWGNVTREQAANNLCAVLESAGRHDVPVALGASKPIGPAPELPRATFIHGEYGLGATPIHPRADAGSHEPAARVLSRVCREHLGEVTVVALGPLSTLAELVQQEPDWAATVRRLVVMGGAVRVPGNALPVSEANIAHDPDAAHAVLTAGWARPPLLVPLDVTHRATLGDAQFDLLRQHRTAAAAFLDAPLHFYREAGSRLVPDGRCPCHDLLATMAATQPGLVHGPVVELSVDTAGGAAWGSVVADLRPAAAGERAAGVPFRRAATTARVEIGLEVDLVRFGIGLGQLLGADMLRPQREPGVTY